MLACPPTHWGMLLCQDNREQPNRQHQLLHQRRHAPRTLKMITQRHPPTQFDEHLSLQVADLLDGLLQGTAEPHLRPEQLQRVADHVVDIDGERVVLGPHVQALFPPYVPLQTHNNISLTSPLTRTPPEQTSQVCQTQNSGTVIIPSRFTENIRVPEHKVQALQEVTCLEVDEETVQLPLAGASIEVLAAGIKQGADQADAEQMLWGVQRAGTAVLIHAEGDEGEEGAENDGRLHHAVVVELAQELGAADPPLVELGLVDLGSEGRRGDPKLRCPTI